MAVPFDLKRLEVTLPGNPGAWRRGRLSVWNMGAAQYGASESGTLIYVTGMEYLGPSYDLVSVNRADGSLTPLPLPTGTYETIRISPDGRRLAYVVKTLSEAGINVYDLAGGGPQRQLARGDGKRVGSGMRN